MIRTLLTGLAFGESPRWHDGRLWVADWAAHELLAIDSDGVSEVILVSCHEGLADRIYERFGVRVTGHVLLPPDRVTAPRR